MTDPVHLESDALRVLLAPSLGGSILRFDRRSGADWIPVMRPTPDPPAGILDCACFPLIPFSNRIRDGRFAFRGRVIQLAANMAGDPSPIHGQGWRASWTPVAITRDAATLTFTHASGEWPWAYEARQTLMLDANGLSIALECRNLDRLPMPCGLGLHPYFDCTPATLLDASVRGVWTIDDDVLPVAHVVPSGRHDLSLGPICGRGLDNGYDGWDGLALIRQPELGHDIRIRAPDTGFLQIYAPPEGSVIVVEPVTHANDALSPPEANWRVLGMRVLEPGGVLRLLARFDVEVHARLR